MKVKPFIQQKSERFNILTSAILLSSRQSEYNEKNNHVKSSHLSGSCQYVHTGDRNTKKIFDTDFSQGEMRIKSGDGHKNNMKEYEINIIKSIQTLC